MRDVDRRQPMARWGSVVFLAIAWLFCLGGELLGAAFFATVASLMVMYAQSAKAKWLKKQKAGG